jgi:hypothetical protein
MGDLLAHSISMLSRFGGDSKWRMDWITGFIDHSFIRLGTTSNYISTVDLHTLQITAANTKSPAACSVCSSRSLISASSCRDLSASHAQVRPVQLISRNWTLIPQHSLSLMTNGQSVDLGIKHPYGAYDQIFITIRQLGSADVALSLTRRRVCRLQLLLALANAVIFGSGSRGTRDHILLSQIRDFPFHRLLRRAGLRWRYSTPPPHGIFPQPVKVTLRLTVSQVSQSWAGIYHCLIVTVLVLWGALSDERTGLSIVRGTVCSSKSFVII